MNGTRSNIYQITGQPGVLDAKTDPFAATQNASKYEQKQIQTPSTDCSGLFAYCCCLCLCDSCCSDSESGESQCCNCDGCGDCDSSGCDCGGCDCGGCDCSGCNC